MGQMPHFRPVSVISRSDPSDPSVAASDPWPQTPGTTSSTWPPEALELAIALHRCLQVSDRQWHAMKHQKGRRGAEQISAALVHLLHDPRGVISGNPERRAETIALLDNALAWLRGDLKDPGCPSHGR